MKKVATDIDIDFDDRTKALSGLVRIDAMTMAADKPQRHPSGVYFQDIPLDPTTGLAAFQFEKAEEYGYFKIDFLNSTIYRGIRSEDHLIRLLDEEPDWSLFEHKEIVSRLNHIKDHFGIVKSIAPKCIEDLAVVLALVRPGKRWLMARSRDEIFKEIWNDTGEGYVYKKSHAVAYAASIVVQLNLICEKMMQELEDLNG
jgi:hypothetical protein